MSWHVSYTENETNSELRGFVQTYLPLLSESIPGSIQVGFLHFVVFSARTAALASLVAGIVAMNTRQQLASLLVAYPLRYISMTRFTKRLFLSSIIFTLPQCLLIPRSERSPSMNLGKPCGLEVASTYEGSSPKGNATAR